MKKGFTMVELLVVLLIVGILAAVAVPMYLANTQRAKASEAVATMGLVRQAERDYFVNHNTYFSFSSGSLTALPPVGAGVNTTVSQYFSNDAFTVDTNTTTWGSGATMPASTADAVDFVITADGSASDFCGNATSLSNCAVNQPDVNNYRIKMDNSGRIFVTYVNGTYTAW